MSESQRGNLESARDGKWNRLAIVLISLLFSRFFHTIQSLCADDLWRSFREITLKLQLWGYDDHFPRFETVRHREIGMVYLNIHNNTGYPIARQDSWQ